MEIISGIYVITSPSNKIYIGLSTDIHARWENYKFLSNSRKQPYLHNSFKKYGISNHKFEVLELVDEDKLSDREIFWISERNSRDKNVGMNLAPGGSFPPKQYGPHTKEHNDKIGLANKGKKHSDETKKKIRDSKLGVPQTSDHISKRSNQLIGVTSKLKGRKRPTISEKLTGRKSLRAQKCKLTNTETQEVIFADSFSELSLLSGICTGSLMNLKNQKQTKKYKHLIYTQL